MAFLRFNIVIRSRYCIIYALNILQDASRDASI